MKKIYIIALVVALAAGFATYYFADIIEDRTSIKDAPTSDVVVAVVDIPANSVITEDMVVIKKYTTVSVTPGAATTLEDVVGKAPKYPIIAGEQISLSKMMAVGSSESTGSLSFQLEEGMYAYTVTVSTETGVSGYICEDDYIDVIVTKAKPVLEENQQEIRQVSEVLFSNIKVLKLSSYSANLTAKASGTIINEYTDITLRLTLEQCLELTDAQANGGNLRMALKSIITGREKAGEPIEGKNAGDNAQNIENNEQGQLVA